MENPSVEYKYHSAEPSYEDEYIWGKVHDVLVKESPAPKRVFEVGCGNGVTASRLKDVGYDVVGIDTSITGIECGRKNNPDLQLFEDSVYGDLQNKYGQFDVVISLEVIEHCYDPRTFIKRVYQLLEPGGLGIISTPYHGYLKNLAIAILGRFDAHFTALWDGGHIKFFSINTMTSLVTEAGFENLRFYRVGRIPSLAKSMVVVFRKPRRR
jgi:2-polyprenyl-3-methyl-5-hydroxy-6-metoxy-1,4-benzoquinol methylase